MPTYDYECTKGHHFEVEQRITEEPLKRCRESKCNAKATRLISATNFILKGSGWYSDGYSSGGGAKGSNGSGNSSSSSGDGGSGKSGSSSSDSSSSGSSSSKPSAD